jgi:hypothetical protein
MVAGSVAALVLALGVAAASPASADPYWSHHHRGYWGPAVGLGIVGLAAGAIIASQGPYYDGGDDCTRWRPVYDAWGRYLGRRPVNVCD